MKQIITLVLFLSASLMANDWKNDFSTPLSQHNDRVVYEKLPSNFDGTEVDGTGITNPAESMAKCKLTQLIIPFATVAVASLFYSSDNYTMGNGIVLVGGATWTGFKIAEIKYTFDVSTLLN